MPPATKQALLDESRKEFDELLKIVESIPAEWRVEAGVVGEWSVKDLLAHLHEWHRMFLGWYAAGQAGSTPALPAEGYKWSQLPALNERIYQQYRDQPYEMVLQALRESFDQVMEVVMAHTNEELFVSNRSAWTGKHPLAGYITPKTASHYHWARDLIRKWKKKAL